MFFACNCAFLKKMTNNNENTELFLDVIQDLKKQRNYISFTMYVFQMLISCKNVYCKIVLQPKNRPLTQILQIKNIAFTLTFEIFIQKISKFPFSKVIFLKFTKQNK